MIGRYYGGRTDGEPLKISGVGGGHRCQQQVVCDEECSFFFFFLVRPASAISDVDHKYQRVRSRTRLLRVRFLVRDLVLSGCNTFGANSLRSTMTPLCIQ